MVPQSSWALCTRHTHTTAWRHVHTVRIAKSLFLSGNSVFAPCKCDNMWIMLVIPSLRRKDFSAVLLPAIVCRWLKTKEYRILYVAHVASEQRLSQTFFDTYYITKQFYPLSAVWHRCGCGKTKCRRITHTHTHKSEGESTDKTISRIVRQGGTWRNSMAQKSKPSRTANSNKVTVYTLISNTRYRKVSQIIIFGDGKSWWKLYDVNLCQTNARLLVRSYTTQSVLSVFPMDFFFHPASICWQNRKKCVHISLALICG